MQALAGFAELRGRWDTLSDLEKQQLEVAEAYIRRKIAEHASGKAAVAARTAPERRADGLFVDVSADEVGGVFTQRTTVAVDAKALLKDLLKPYCSWDITGLICKPALDDIVDDLVPALYLIGSLTASADAGAGTAAADLLGFLYSYPPESTVLKDVLDILHVNLAIPPTAAVSYLTADAKFTPQNLPSGKIDFSANSFSAYQAYEEIIEYSDNNGNGRYDAGEQVQRYKLGDKKWNSKALQTLKTSNNAKVYVAKSTTSDNVVTMTCATASSLVVDADSNLLTPNSTKCSIEISNFPFKNSGTYLALKSHVGLHNFIFTGDIKYARGIGVKRQLGWAEVLTYFFPTVFSAFCSRSAVITNLAISNNAGESGYINWVDHATTVNGNRVNVVATGTAGISGDKNLVAEFTAAATGTVTSQSKARTLYFSFQSSPTPSYINWDPSIGYGAEPVFYGNAAGATAAATVVVAVLAAVVALFLAL